MSIQAPEKHWWRQPLIGVEKTWLTAAICWIVVLNLAMPLSHVFGKHNASGEYYRWSTDNFDQLVDKFIEKYSTGEEQGGIPVVAPPPGSDVFIRAQQWGWDPVLKLKVNETYRVHLSSIDVNHGFSIFPINSNWGVVPGLDNIVIITPDKAGDYYIICNEFCGIGHHTMIGKIIVES